MAKLILSPKTTTPNLVVKSNSLIEAQYKLNLSEQKLILTLVSMIEKNDIDFKEYEFKISDFLKLIGTKGKGYSGLVRKWLKDLREKTVVIEREHGGELLTGWFSSAEYIPGSGRIIMCFDPKLKPYLLQLKEKYTRFHLDNVMRLRSEYAIRVYELLKQYVVIGERKFHLDELKQILQCKDYKLYGDFKRKVLEAARKEINEKTDLNVTYLEIKDTRRVASIEFFIQSKKLPESILNLLPEKYKGNEKIINALQDRLTTSPVRVVQNQIEYVLSCSPKEFDKYLLHCLARGYGGDYDRSQESPGEDPPPVPIYPGLIVIFKGVEYAVSDAETITIGGAVLPAGKLRQKIISGEIVIKN